jgi:branched-chain amino acid transport system substrate-binding protein
VISLHRRQGSAARGRAVPLLTAGVCCAAALLASSCTSSGGDHARQDAAALEGEVSFGVLAPLSGAGDLAARGQDLLDGATMAADEINANGGVLGRKVVLTSLDDACDERVAYEAAKSLANTGVVGVVGGVCDESTAKEVPVIEAAGIPYLVSVANGKELITPDVMSTYLTTGTPYQQGLSAVHWMGYRSAQRLALLSESTPESKELASEVVNGLDATPRLVSVQNVAATEPDLASAVRVALAAKPDFVLWTGAAAPGGELVKVLRAAGYKGTFTCTTACDSPDFLEAAGAAAEGAFVTATPTPQNIPIADKWKARFEAAFKHDPGLEALQAYDGIRALAQATKQAGALDGAAIAANVTQLGEDFTTFLGTLRFARDHTMIYDNRLVLVVKNGAFTFERSLRTDI